MMKFIGKIFYFLLCFILFIQITIYFLPKKQLLEYANSKLSSYYISLNSKQIDENNFKIVLENNTLRYDKLKVASSQKIEFLSLIFLEKIKITNIKFGDIATGIFPPNIKDIIVYWTPLYGYKVKISAQGDIGEIYGYIDLLHQNVTVHLKPSKIATLNYKKILRKMKKEAKGYRYVQSF